MTQRRGQFIVIEGLDRSGKSTQADALVRRMGAANVPAKLMKFPDRTTSIGKMIDGYLRSETNIDDHAIHLLFSANRWELAAQIEQTLLEGITIVCDRYAFSGVAFSASKGLPFEWCRSPDIGLPAPDITLFLDVSPEKAKERGGYGAERYEKEEIQRSVRKIFTNFAGEARERGELDWVTIDACQSILVVEDSIWKTVSPILEEKGVKSIQKIWMSHSSDR